MNAHIFTAERELTPPLSLPSSPRSVLQHVVEGPIGLAPRVKPFIAKLSHLVSQPHSFKDCVVWDSSGTSFIVSANDRFVGDVLPRLFGHSNMASFTRASPSSRVPSSPRSSAADSSNLARRPAQRALAPSPPLARSSQHDRRADPSHAPHAGLRLPSPLGRRARRARRHRHGRRLQRVVAPGFHPRRQVDPAPPDAETVARAPAQEGQEGGAWAHAVVVVAGFDSAEAALDNRHDDDDDKLGLERRERVRLAAVCRLATPADGGPAARAVRPAPVLLLVRLHLAAGAVVVRPEPLYPRPADVRGDVVEQRARAIARRASALARAQLDARRPSSRTLARSRLAHSPLCASVLAVGASISFSLSRCASPAGTALTPSRSSAAPAASPPLPRLAKPHPLDRRPCLPPLCFSLSATLCNRSSVLYVRLRERKSERAKAAATP